MGLWVHGLLGTGIISHGLELDLSLVISIFSNHPRFCIIPHVCNITDIYLWVCLSLPYAIACWDPAISDNNDIS
jgi:hypothetical protein